MINNPNELIQELIKKKVEEEIKQSQQNENSISRINDISSKVGNFGEGLSTVGGYIDNSIGKGIQTLGTNLQNGAGAVQQAISKAVPAISGASAGASVGASAGSGAISVNPLVALGVMALDGTNRKRAKASGEYTQKLAENAVDVAENRVKQNVEQGIMQDVPQVVQPQNTETDNIISQAIDDYTNNSVKPTTIPQNVDSVKKDIYGNLASGLNDFIEGYKENRNNGFNIENLRPSEDKGFMQKLGEGVGTIARVAQSPTVQGVLAGGLTGALSGDPLYGLTTAYKIANAKYKGDLYRDILEQQGVEVGNNRVNLDSSDLAKILVSKKYQKDYMTRGEYERLRLDSGQLSVDEYNQILNSENYNPDEMVNIGALGIISKAARYDQQNKTERNKNYHRNKNNGQNIIKVEYGEKPDSHNYTHVLYGEKPASHNYTHVLYGNKPDSHNYTHVQYGKKPNDSSPDVRINVVSPDGVNGTIPKSQLQEALKKGYKIRK